MPELVTVGDLEIGQFRRTLEEEKDGEFPNAFVCRLKCESLPAGAIEASGKSCFLAFSGVCTHLGCSLIGIPSPDGSEPETLPLDGSVLRCPCHFSSFDLCAHGLIAGGPATACLPQIRLEETDNPDQVKLVNWIRDASVPYGVPYEVVAEKPPDSADD